MPIHRRALGFLFFIGFVGLLGCPVLAQAPAENVGVTGPSNNVQQVAAAPDSMQPVRTGSPRETLETFLRLTRELELGLLTYRVNQNRTNADRILRLAPQFLSLLDLSTLPKARQLQTGVDSLATLLDITGRLDLPPLNAVPDDAETLATWRIPGSPITISRIDEGLNEGQFLFSARTLAIAPQFLAQIEHMPLRTTAGVRNWHWTMAELHGPNIPAGLVSILPGSFKGLWWDTPAWKILLVFLMLAFAAVVLVLWHRLARRYMPSHNLADHLRRMLTPAAIVVLVLISGSLIYQEVNVAGTFARMVDTTQTVLYYIAAAWLFWFALLAVVEAIILSPDIADESLDANMLRLGGRIVGVIGGVVIVAFGAQDLGLPVFSVVAGLGVGGLAVALAVRPTLENLIGGAVLYMDRPVKVGDYCGFGERRGFIEKIGVRSTQIRGLDRTLISIPNAIFADMEIANWAECDRMLILTTIGLRYETDPDQLRYVLAKLREMAHAHPRIDRDTVRIRFVGHGASSFDIEIRLYALTREWNDFYAIREDFLLRVNEIVGSSGTGFAFPSHTVYMAKDGGLDSERNDETNKEVADWRRYNRLPFPRLSQSRMDTLANTLDYPPRGSPESGIAEDERTVAAEPLSAEPLSTEPAKEDDESGTAETEQR